MAVTTDEKKYVTTHHDGHGLTESIQIETVDEVGPGGAHHRYLFTATTPATTPGGPIQGHECGYLQFQKGPRNELDSTPGVLTVAVLAALVDQLQDFQKGPFPSRESALAITHMQEAMHWLRARADERASRKVLGRNEK